MQMTSLRERPRFALVFPKYTFYVPNPCILGTRPVLPCKNGSCCKLELVGTKSVFALRYSLYLSVVGCSQVELSYQYRAGATSPVGQVSTGPLFSPSALTADLGDYDVRGSIDERSTGSTELAA